MEDGLFSESGIWSPVLSVSRSRKEILASRLREEIVGLGSIVLPLEPFESWILTERVAWIEFLLFIAAWRSLLQWKALSRNIEHFLFPT